ncbi:spore germination protein ['Paenibacillus yunnanensis' Narsing Rao et al. 2020]|uniref:spore germination protein n=1 Tax=Paenibacillus tengchongensis TaxID=2608684 RepID=UPI00124C5F29|nr:spore germination protein [Paenibacillus tengchongensis]
MLSSIIAHIPDWLVFFQAAIAFLLPVGANYLYNILNAWGNTGRFTAAAAGRNAAHKDKTALSASQPSPSSASGTPFSGNYAADLQAIRSAIGSNSDLHFREFPLTKLHTKGTLIYVDGMQNDRLLNLRIMEYLMFEATADTLASPLNSVPAMPFSDLTAAADLTAFNRSVLFGHAGLLIDGMPHGLLIELPGGANRSVTEPVSEALLRGPRLGFSEVLSENTSMLRCQGFSDGLELKSYRIGNQMQKDLVIAYMKDIVNPELLQEVETRISTIDSDFLAESGYVEQLIEDNWLSPFQQVQNTERPDRVISALMEGRIAILLNGTPFALIVPVTFSMLLQSPEDYYERWLPGSLLRMLRFAAAFLALMAPALYISFISFHPGLIPTELAISIIEARQGVPFPSIIEVLILEVSIEILREAGIRLPKPVGPAMGIVGGLIIGDAAVNAGIVSPFLVIVVAVTAISSFSIPMYSAGITLRLLRFAGMLFAAFLGMFGTILFFLLLCSHLTKLKSFGVPYLTPVSPFRLRDWKDLFFRAPLSLMKRRPAMLKTQNDRRKSKV